MASECPLVRRPRRCARTLLLALFAVAGFPVLANDIEAKVEAAYLFHLTKFVDWPTLPANEFRICVLGAPAVESMMAELSGRQVRDSVLRVEADNIPDPASCQILFIGRGDRRLPELLKRLRSMPVLTVSDADDFARRGGIVGFYAEAGKIKLEINPDAAHAANLKISAKLLELARTVSRP